MARIKSDKEAMDEITAWMKKADPNLTGDIPNWVWNLVSLLDDLIDDTARRAY